jgi:hypothetical protein
MFSGGLKNEQRTWRTGKIPYAEINKGDLCMYGIYSVPGLKNK